MSAPPRPAPSKPLDRSIVEGPIARAVWMLAWPTMLQNMIAGMQGVVDHALVAVAVTDEPDRGNAFDADQKGGFERFHGLGQSLCTRCHG